MFRTLAFAALAGLAGLAHAGVAESADLPGLDQADPMFKQSLERKSGLAVQLPGFSHHFDKPRYKDGSLVRGRQFNENNWGIGAQLEVPLDGAWQGWVRKTSFGIMKDSLDAYGVYAGAAWQKRVYDSGTLSADIGGGAFLFYRTLQFDGKHLLVPAVLPVMSALHKGTGLGANLVLVPQFKTSNGTLPGVVYLQFTQQF